MPLLDLWKSSPDTISMMNLEQILSVAGDGKLLDGSRTSAELTEYLSQTSTERLEDYIQYCLSNSFQQSGFVLQDIVNELGKRLEYSVTNGLYSGKKNSIGFDGIWDLQENNSIIIEVKTTDAYRINLDTIASYRTKLIKENKITENSSILIVVGRQDTGDIEAQIRGSRHAWTIRMISAEALLKLVKIKESSNDDIVLYKIRNLLTPFEYTRLDNIIDIVFTATTDSNTADIFSNSYAEHEPTDAAVSRKQNRTDRKIIEFIRGKIIDHIGKNNAISLIPKTRALYWTNDSTTRIACTISKPYPKAGGYWYALHKKWLDFLTDGVTSFYVVGFVGLQHYCTVPLDIIKEITPYLHKTDNTSNPYWHIIVGNDQNKFTLLVPGQASIDLSPYTHYYGQTKL